MVNERNEFVNQNLFDVENCSYNIAIARKFILFIITAKIFLLRYLFFKFFLIIFSGRFGSGIASYFRFLRWLFYLDLVLTVIVLSVTTLPYAILDNYLNFDNYIQVVQKDWKINNSFVAEAQNCSLWYQNYLQMEMSKKGLADHVKDVLQGTVSVLVFYVYEMS